MAESNNTVDGALPRDNPYLTHPGDILGEIIQAARALGAASRPGTTLTSQLVRGDVQAAEALMRRCDDLRRETLDHLEAIGNFMWHAAEGPAQKHDPLDDRRLIYNLGMVVERLTRLAQSADFEHGDLAHGLLEMRK